MLIDSVNFWVDSVDAVLTDCYADTGKTGYLIKQSTRMFGCSYFNNYTYEMDDVTVIEHIGGNLLVSGGMFRKTSPKSTLYKGDDKNLIWRDNILEGDWKSNEVLQGEA